MMLHAHNAKEENTYLLEDPSDVAFWVLAHDVIPHLAWFYTHTGDELTDYNQAHFLFFFFEFEVQNHLFFLIFKESEMCLCT